MHLTLDHILLILIVALLTFFYFFSKKNNEEIERNPALKERLDKVTRDAIGC